jgi:hypothetical protein
MPLELTVHPKLERPMWGHQIEGYRQQVRAESAIREAKRFTDAELAAEWHYQDNRCGQVFEGYSVAHDGSSMGSEEDEIEKLQIAYRFATLPHHDEQDES